MLEVLLLFLCCECITVHWQILLLFCSLLRYCYCFVLCRLVSFSHIVSFCILFRFVFLWNSYPFIHLPSFIWHYHSSGCSHSWDCHLFICHYHSSFIWLLPLLGLPFIHHYGAVSILLSPFSSVCHLSPVHLAPSPITLLRFCGAGCCFVQTV